MMEHVSNQCRHLGYYKVFDQQTALIEVATCRLIPAVYRGNLASEMYINLNNQLKMPHPVVYSVLYNV